MGGVATPSVSAAVKQLSDQNLDGTALGASPSDLIGFYTSTIAPNPGGPISQPTSPAQAALFQGASGNGNAGGALTIYTTSQSPSSVATATTAEQSITVTGTQWTSSSNTDLPIVNKPSAQAGLALLKGRFSAANTYKLTFANVTSGTLTPTGSESYLVTTLSALLTLNTVLTPAAVGANTIVEQTFALSNAAGLGLAPGMVVEVTKPTTQAGLGITSARVVGNNQLAISFINTTAGPLTPTAGETYEFAGLNGLSAASQMLQFGVNVGTLAGVAANTTSEQSLTAAGLVATDVAVGVQKPTLQAGLGLFTGRISAANTYRVTFGNFTGGVLTPTASEVYGLTVFRPYPEAPASVFTSASIVPTAVATLTTVEQTFTVTGLVSGQPVLVCPNFNLSQTPGLGFGGARASATNTLAINFVNTTAASITPPAGTWSVMQFNTAVPTAGNYVQLEVGPQQTSIANQSNAVRAALVALGLIKGS